MSLLDKIKQAIEEGKCPPIFTPSDLKNANIEDIGTNLSNYDKKNGGANCENALVSRKIEGVTYYTFDEQVLPKLKPGDVLNCTEDEENGVRFYKQ